MDPRKYPSRYLHISGAFALGGTFTNVAPGVDVQIPTVAPVHLPMAGGISESRAKKVSLDCRKVKFGAIDRKLLSKLKNRELFSIASAYTSCKSEPEVKGQPFRNSCVSEMSSLRLGDKVLLKHSLLNMQSSHDPTKTRFPQITFGATELQGLKLGKSELKITLDLETFNQYPTLEELETARRRGARIVAEIVGYGMSADAFHVTAPSENGDGAFRVMRNALRDAAIEPSQIDYINAHGTSTAMGDRIETIAIKRCFGDHAHKVAVSSTKSMTGHLLGGAGGLEAGITVLAIRDQVAPPTTNYETPDPECDLDYVPNHARPMRIDYALSNSFGFGGTNGALIFKRFMQ